MALLYTTAEHEVIQPNQKLLKTQKSGCGLQLQSLCIQGNYSHCVFIGLHTPLSFRCSGCMGSTCERRVSARRWCTRRSICCCCWGATRTRSRRPSPSSPPWGDSPPPRLSWLADVGTADSTPCSAVLPVWWWPFSGENVRAQRMSELSFFFFFVYWTGLLVFCIYSFLFSFSFFMGRE